MAKMRIRIFAEINRSRVLPVVRIPGARGMKDIRGFAATVCTAVVDQVPFSRQVRCNIVIPDCRIQ